MRSFSFVAIAVAVVWSCASAYANDTILLTRPVNGTSADGTLVPQGSGLFAVNDDGHHLRQLTPFMAGSYYMPSWVVYYYSNASLTGNWLTSGEGYWLTKNFSPNGRSILYVQNPSSDPADGQYSGKYYVENVHTHSSQPLFAGSNDNAAPGYGYLAWDPADGNTIAFTNSTADYPVAPASKACVNLMDADGSHQRTLWCAPPTIALPDYPDWPLLAVESIRWSGNGKKLLAYASYNPPPLGSIKKWGAPFHQQMPYFLRPATTAAGPVGGLTGYSALFEVDAATGTAVEIAANVVDPPSSDISYDGTKVIYQQYDSTQCGDEDQEAVGASLCFKDLTTGTVTDLFAPGFWDAYGEYASWWGSDWYPQILLSPDGSQAAFNMSSTNNGSTAYPANLYVINTDGTNLRQLTGDAKPPTTETAWTPVAWSRDGTRLLANRATAPVAGSTDQTWPSEVHIIAVSDGKDQFVTHGYAVDWHQKP